MPQIRNTIVIPATTNTFHARAAGNRLQVRLNEMLRDHIKEIKRKGIENGIKIKDRQFAEQIGVSNAMLSMVLSEKAFMSIETCIVGLTVLGHTFTFRIDQPKS